MYVLSPQKKLYHLGIKQYVNQSTLSSANENSDWRIFADFGEYLIKTVRLLYANYSIPDVDIDNDPAKDYSGEDEQLNMAVKEILEEMKTFKYELPDVPAFPNKSK